MKLTIIPIDNAVYVDGALPSRDLLNDWEENRPHNFKAFVKEVYDCGWDAKYARDFAPLLFKKYSKKYLNSLIKQQELKLIIEKLS